LIRCFRCGTANLEGANFCVKCNFKLPKIDTQIAPQTSIPKGARLAKIIELCEGITEKTLSPKNMLDDLTKEFRAFRKANIKLRKIRLPKPLQEEFQIQLDIGIEGTDKFIDALKMVKSCIPEALQDSLTPITLPPDKTDTINKAVELAKEPNELLNECYERSRESMRAAQEEAYMYEDMLSMGMEDVE